MDQFNAKREELGFGLLWFLWVQNWICTVCQGNYASYIQNWQWVECRQLLEGLPGAHVLHRTPQGTVYTFLSLRGKWLCSALCTVASKKSLTHHVPDAGTPDTHSASQLPLQEKQPSYPHATAETPPLQEDFPFPLFQRLVFQSRNNKRKNITAFVSPAQIQACLYLCTVTYHSFSFISAVVESLLLYFHYSYLFFTKGSWELTQ